MSTLDGRGKEGVLSTSPPVAVFKPSDEEAGSENNPHGLRGENHMMREGFRMGDGAVRERVAYKLKSWGKIPDAPAPPPVTFKYDLASTN